MRFNGVVPGYSDGLEANLEFRLDLRERAAQNAAYQRAAIEACRDDVLFFFNAFCFLYEPRPMVVDGVQQPHIIPFLTWPHQDPVIRMIREHLGFEDIGVEKSRGEGASWISVLMALHDWLFQPMSAIGFVSRNELAVDSPEDPDSLFWKLTWELDQLPTWMVPPFKRNLTEHTLRNLANKSTITGYPATGDVASGGRKLWMLMDELSKFPRGADADAMASTQYVTNSRLVVSTPKGSEGAYYELMHAPSAMIRVVLDWKVNPRRNRGLYKLVSGIPTAIDPANPLPENYAVKCQTRLANLRSKGFKLEGVVRSPWYDHECDRPGTSPQNIAQELDRDYGGSMYRIFGPEFVAKAEATVRAPFTRGAMDYSKETFEPLWESRPDGAMLLWTSLDTKSRPPEGRYVVAADLSAGLGGSFSSNSVIEVFDVLAMEQVLEYATNITEVSAVADLAMVVGKWFHNAYLIWEANFMGGAFTSRIKDNEYHNIYYRDSLTKKGRKRTKQIGWWTNDVSKERMFSEFIRSVTAGELKLHSEMLVQECSQYVRLNGKIEHIQSISTRDESSKGRAHGDRVMAACVCLQGVRDRPLAMPAFRDADGRAADPPAHSIGGRQKERELALQERENIWDDRCGTGDPRRQLCA